MNLESMLRRIPSYSRELGLDLQKPEDRFKWFLASVLFAKRISADIAKKTYLQFDVEGLTTPDALLRAGWDKLVEVLDAGGYVRYDFSTATNLLETAEAIKKCGGLEHLHAQAENSRDLEKRLQGFRGVGPVAVNIFLRELRGIWPKARPKPSKLARDAGRKLELSEVERFESALVRIRLEYCKRRRCAECPVVVHCKRHEKKVSRRSAAPHRSVRNQ